MTEYKLTNKAVEDLSGIWDFTCSKWSEEQADIYYNTLISSCHNIANNPKLGKNYNGISTELVGLKISRHIIFYRIRVDEMIEITRILHERMDLKNRIAE